MSVKGKNNEDSVVIFKQEPGQSKDDASLIYDTKVTETANNLHPEHTPFIFQESIRRCKIGTWPQKLSQRIVG